VVEGLFAMHEASLKDQMDLRVYIDASDIAKLTRRIKRDRVERRLPLDDVLYRYENHVLPAYERYIAPYKKSCDIVINNEQGFEKGLEVLVSFLRSKAAELSY
jgi:Uridine kinase